jgi:outer membrane protein assembly factor BamB
MLWLLLVTLSPCHLVTLSSARAGDWPQFRGPGGTAVSDEKGLPVKWGPAEGVRWKAELPGRGVSSPVVAAGRVYVTASSSYRQGRLHVLCFDAATGKKLWERRIASTGSTMCNPKTSMAGPTPVTDGRHVYALFATGDLAALDRDGNLLWYRSLARDYPDVTNQVGMAASPVLAGDTLLLPLENAGDSFALAVDAKTGKNRWKADRYRDINWVTPLVVRNEGRTDVLFQTAKEITAYDPQTGKVRWTYAGDGLSSVPSPLAGEGGLIFVAGREYAALRPGPDGATPEVVWKTNRIRPGYSTPVVADGRVYGLTGVNVTCVKAKDGELVWQQRLNGPFSASPVIGDGKLYAVNEKGLTTVVALGEKPKVLATNALDETVLATPAISGGALYLRSDRHLYCIGAKKE